MGGVGAGDRAAVTTPIIQPEVLAPTLWIFDEAVDGQTASVKVERSFQSEQLDFSSSMLFVEGCFSYLVWLSTEVEYESLSLPGDDQRVQKAKIAASLLLGAASAVLSWKVLAMRT
ncbi:hypothetical protein PVAG01_06534 [Phlyctema vagabunda]|uniref:Uncharacterized protein n=1 Tax=Phlyctema vagabunda TaxID=108571 RepID=A0ABR4PGG9_9HELO